MILIFKNKREKMSKNQDINVFICENINENYGDGHLNGESLNISLVNLMDSFDI